MKKCPKCGLEMIVTENKDKTRIYECWDCNKAFTDNCIGRFLRNIFHS